MSDPGASMDVVTSTGERVSGVPAAHVAARPARAGVRPATGDPRLTREDARAVRPGGGTRASRLRAFAASRAGGLPRPFWVLWSGTLINRIGYMVEPFLAFYLTGVRGLSLATTGAVLAVSGAGSVVSQLVSGSLSDRLGRRAVLTLGMLANAAALLALGYSRGLVPIVAATLLFGLTIDIYRPASSALVADLLPPAERPRAYGLLFWAVNLGFSVAMVLGGTLARSGFQWLFWADAGTCAIVGVMAWRGLPGGRPGRAGQAGERRSRKRPAGGSPAAPVAARGRPRELGGSHPERLGGLLRDRVMIVYLALTLCYCFVYLQAYTTLPLAMRLRGLSPQEYGLAMALNGILIIALQPLISGWLGKHDRCAVLAGGFVIVGLGFGLTSLAGSVVAYAATVAVWTLGEIVTAGLGAAIVADLAPATMRGRYNGAYGAVWSAAYLLGPLGGTRLLALGAPVLWLSCGLMGAAAALGLLALGPAIRRRSHAAQITSLVPEDPEK
jgi:MFS family permease